MAPPGRLVGTGRGADVYEHEPGWVLRRYREPSDTEQEVAGMEYARSHGFPVPAARALNDTDIVMERLQGPTMLDDLGKRPWRVGDHAAVLAHLHRQLHAIEAPAWLPTPLGEGSDLLHCDLHPDNVMLTEAGPMVIDWTGVSRGPGEADVAYTWIILASSVPPGGLRNRLAAAAGRSLFVHLFLRHFDRDEIARWVAAGVPRRLADPHVPPAEQEKVRRLEAEVSGRSI